MPSEPSEKEVFKPNHACLNLAVTFFAHTASLTNGDRNPDTGCWQRLNVHLMNVAKLAQSFAASFGMGAETYLAGLLHDLGKYRDEFQSYLQGHRPSSKDTQHAVFGADWALGSLAPGLQTLLYLVIKGHHSGLPDTSLPDFENLDIIRPELERRASVDGILLDPSLPTPAWLSDDPECVLRLEFATRMLFSALIDADRLDSAHWPASSPPCRLLDADGLLAKCITEAATRSANSKAGSSLKQLRNTIFDSCVRAGSKPTGFFSLTVPTGGGKTLASMAFALSHAKAHRLRRVVVVIPYLSIIEQNAADYRRLFGDDVVLECHSAVEPKPDASEQECDVLELATENWDAPIIVTTSVQFIESLFANSPSRCRKLHRLAGSVVILDEVQTLPHHLLAPALSVFRELQEHYGVSIVFCSATQPAFRKCPPLSDGFKPGEVTEITDAADGRRTVEETYAALRRVNYQLPPPNERLGWDQLSHAMLNTKRQQVLCVVNLVRHARDLWETMSKAVSDGRSVIHLSSFMCPQHRLDLIGRIKSELPKGTPLFVISTQLIEAGVDVDFPVVYRAMGPLDALVQAAGRCNREGNPERGEVHIFRPMEDKTPPGIYRIGTQRAEISLKMIEAKGIDPCEALAQDPGIFASYFEQVWQYAATDVGGSKSKTIQEHRAELNFPEVAALAKVIKDEGQRPVIITECTDGTTFPSAAVVAEIRGRASGSKRFDREDLRKLQRFMVNLRPRDYAKLEAASALIPLVPNLDLCVLSSGYYHHQLGLLTDRTAPPEDYLS